ncbi:MAG: 50S ribosome-binding GTPase, partial [Proteobacteria bacterium]|nr:50S ribosome-binding GTPase [Pseudomonadota bacterium]
MPTPIAVLVGRTNTGKSRLYNALCGRPEALVSDSEHLTRDWRETRVEFAGTGVRLRDTAGLTEAEDKLSRMIEAQTRAQLECADVLLFMVDARSGLLPLDEDFARLIRRTARPVVLIINKMDTIVGRQTWTEFAALGFGRSVHISAERHEGLAELGDAVLNALDEASRLPPPVSGKPRVVAIRKTAAQKAAAARKATGKDVDERTDDGADGVATNKATPKATKGGTGGTPAETEPEETTAPAPEPDSKASNANEPIKDASTNNY